MLHFMNKIADNGDGSDVGCYYKLCSVFAESNWGWSSMKKLIFLLSE